MDPSILARHVLRWVAIGGLALVCACGSGSSSSSRFDAHGALIAVRFPNPQRPGLDETEPPFAASLIQPVVFEFDARPDPDLVSQDSLSVRDAFGFPVPGRYVVDGTRVTFTPSLPTRPLRMRGDIVLDDGGAGLDPGSAYSLRVSPARLSPFLVAIDSDLRARYPDPADPAGIVVPLRTTTDPNAFYEGLEVRTPRLLGTTPVDGSSDVSPQLYTDPDARFAERGPFLAAFDTPLRPGESDLEAARLLDLDDTSEPGLSLGVDVTIVENEVDGALLQIRPSGVLPFGHLLALVTPREWRSLSDARATDPEERVLATFTVADAGSEIVRDDLLEDFDSDARRDPATKEIPPGAIPAEWNERGSGVLLAGLEFEGLGELGRFIPAPPEDPDSPRVILLDTDRQALPLLDGSTPDAPPGTEVFAGKFSFTEIDVPRGVEIHVVGNHPLVFAATESVRIAGVIRIQGQNGNSDSAFDSAVAPLPGGTGGPGGGRGGEGQPQIFLGGDVDLTALVSPTHGGRGFGPSNLERIGGHGGQCGIMDNPDSRGEFGTDTESNCNEITEGHNGDWKAPGGGGGSMLESGRAHRKWGIGNVLPDGFGHFVVRSEADGQHWDELQPGDPGDEPFADGDAQNDFVGSRGEQLHVFGGQGGGAGGSVSDAYYCGAWCRSDIDPDNDELCMAEFGDPPTFGDSVGDSRGGSGGGGGGALEVLSLGPIVLESTCAVYAEGGDGGKGEALSCSNYGGCGGGGSGGAAIFQSAHSIRVEDGARLDVGGGQGGWAYPGMELLLSCPGGEKDAIGSAGDGAIGLVQLQVPVGTTADVGAGVDITPGAWVDPNNQRNPAELTSRSAAVSAWFDLGRVIARLVEGKPPRFTIHGLDVDGFVVTDAEGSQPDPHSVDVRCDYLGQFDPLRPGEYVHGEEPRAYWIPPNATVQLEFQSADAVVPGSKEVDPATFSDWSPSPAIGAGRQFLRWRASFDVTADGSDLEPRSRRPAVQFVRVRGEY